MDGWRGLWDRTLVEVIGDHLNTFLEGTVGLGLEVRG
jgi:hypothetical protein